MEKMLKIVTTQYEQVLNELNELSKKLNFIFYLAGQEGNTYYFKIIIPHFDRVALEIIEKIARRFKELGYNFIIY